MKFHLTRRSSNPKTGPIPVSTTSAESCPPSCPFYKAGCYAENSRLAGHWRKVTGGERGTAFAEFCKEIELLPPGTLWRHNQAGDLPGEGEDIDVVQLAQLVRANRGRRGFTYTHKPVLGDSERDRTNRAAVLAACDEGFTVNVSTETMAEADRAADLGLPVVLAMLPDAPQRQKTPAGRTVYACPAETRDDVTCETCGLCARRDAGRAIVGFRAHGAGKVLASEAILRKVEG